MIVRLQESIDAVCAGANVQLRAGVYSLDFSASATQEQRDAANAVLAAFDTSAEAHAAWERDKRRDAAVALLTSNEPTMVALRAFAVVTKRNVQALVKKLCDRIDPTGATSAAIPLQTMQQLIEAWADAIANGDVDQGMPAGRT